MNLHPIWTMTAITLAAAAGLWLGAFFLPARSRRSLTVWVLAGLPMSFLVNLLVKTPLALGISRLLGIAPAFNLSMPWGWLAFLALLAPVTEELIKWLPGLGLRIAKKLNEPERALWTGLAVGIGFGLGEILYLAYGIARSGLYADMPWYYFTGFLNERIVVVPLHGFLSAFSFCGLAFGRGRAVLGLLAAMLGHLLINLSAILFQLQLVSANVTYYALLATALLLFVAFNRLQRAVRSEQSYQQDSAEVMIYRKE
jgi:hypothetical protein